MLDRTGSEKKTKREEGHEISVHNYSPNASAAPANRQQSTTKHSANGYEMGTVGKEYVLRITVTKGEDVND
jgi:hypothetical protein